MFALGLRSHFSKGRKMKNKYVLALGLVVACIGISAQADTNEPLIYARCTDSSGSTAPEPAEALSIDIGILEGQQSVYQLQGGVVGPEVDIGVKQLISNVGGVVAYGLKRSAVLRTFVVNGTTMLPLFSQQDQGELSLNLNAKSAVFTYQGEKTVLACSIVILGQ
jgi:hypothetical protein